jgi:hypothetical protein
MRLAASGCMHCFHCEKASSIKQAFMDTYDKAVTYAEAKSVTQIS